jgi:acyl carrier protein
MALTRDGLLAFLKGELKLEPGSFDDAAPLFSSGVIDSFMLVSLMGYVEKQGGFRIAPGDVTLDNLDTVERILAFSSRMSG